MLEIVFNDVVTGYGHFHLELAELRYMDARGATLLVQATEQLGSGCMPVLHNPTDVLRRLLKLLWPDVETIKMDTP